MSLPIVAIVGRPNVGKSTLFNRLVGFKKSAVHDRPGVTRDRLYETAEALGRKFIMVDTGGIEPDVSTSLHEQMRRQVLVAIDEATVIVFLCDGRTGATAADIEVADLLRRTKKPVVLAVNKIDGAKHDELMADFWTLGFDNVVGVSAEHGRQVYELIEAIFAHLPPPQAGEDAFEDEPITEETQLPDPEDFPEDWKPVGSDELPSPLRIAVIGRPNIGKSTLVNRMLGEDRQVVHDAPGTTTDPVDTPFEVDGKAYVIVDTAGVRRKSKVEDSLERWISLRAIQSIERCHVCLLMIDATEGVTDQDAKLAELVAGRGRALILLFNKWDLVRQSEDIDAASTEDDKATKLPHAAWAPHLFVSAKTGKGLHRVLSAVDEAFTQFNRHLSTSEVNRWLTRVLSTHSPPQRHHKPVRLYYGAQTRVRPPTFVIFSNTPEGVTDSYKAFLQNRLREDYGFQGSSIRMHFRKRRKAGEND